MDTKRNKETLKTKDYIMVGIFSMLFAVALFAIAAVLGIVPIGFPLFGVVGNIPCGIIFIYIITKIRKKGTMSILTIITALLYWILGAYPLVPVFVLIGGFIAEGIITLGKYEKFSFISMGYVVFMTSIWFGFMYPMIFEAQKYLESSVGSNLSKDYAQTMISYLSGKFLWIFIAGTILSAIIGSILGKKMFKKHFAKINS